MDSDTAEIEVTKNAYGDIQIPAVLVPRTVPEAREYLAGQLAAADRGAWLQLPFNAEHAQLLPLAQELGFGVHSASHGIITLHAWRKRASPSAAPGSAPNPTPPVGHHAVGAGALVINGDGKVLGIKERFDRSGVWLTPGGHVDEGEGFIAAAVREAREEAGVEARPLGVAGIYELHVGGAGALEGYPRPLSAADRAKIAQNKRFGTTAIGVVVLCYAGDDRLAPDPEEIGEAAWLEPEAFAAGAHDREAALVRTLAAGGQIAAAAVLARAERPAGSSASACAGAAGALPRPSLAEVAAARATATRGLIGAVEARFKHRRLPAASFLATYYSALPLGGLIGAGLAASPSLLAVMPLTAAALAASLSASPAAGEAPSHSAAAAAPSFGSEVQPRSCQTTASALAPAAALAGVATSLWGWSSAGTGSAGSSAGATRPESAPQAAARQTQTETESEWLWIAKPGLIAASIVLGIGIPFTVIALVHDVITGAGAIKFR